MRDRRWRISQKDRNKNLRQKRREKRKVKRLKHREELRRQARWQRSKSYIKSRRHRVIRDIHRPFRYEGSPITVSCSGEIGIEEDRTFEKTLDMAEKAIDFNTSALTFDLRGSTRLWPSALTMLCSLQQWTHIGARLLKNPEPKLQSTTPTSSAVQSYLIQSGFYDFVGVKPKGSGKLEKIGEVVPIIRPKNRASFRENEDKIKLLLTQHSNLTPDQIELFDCVILSESYVNVTEHGVVTNDLGWWLICQVHPKHKFISLCIADNGIGFRNSLALGPQSKSLPYANTPQNEGRLIEFACHQNVSGAEDASEKEGTLIKKHPRGSKRGNGLSKIIKRCGELGIRLNILSHYGYVSFDTQGNLIRCGSRTNRIFAGTLYHFIIPGK